MIPSEPLLKQGLLNKHCDRATLGSISIKESVSVPIAVPILRCLRYNTFKYL